MIAELLREARNQLFERGHYKGACYGPDGSVCMVGAVDAACNALNTRLGFFKAIDVLVSVVPAGEHDPVAEWNDVPDRTFDEVIDAFDRAEKIAEQVESEL